MRIGDSYNIGASGFIQQNNSKHNASAKKPTKDTFERSSSLPFENAEFVLLKNYIAKLADIREDRVETAKSRIAEGFYDNNIDSVIDSLI